MVQEISAACRASMGLAFKASSDPKHAGGDPPRPPRRNKRRRSLHPPVVKIFFVPKRIPTTNTKTRPGCYSASSRSSIHPVSHNRDIRPKGQSHLALTLVLRVCVQHEWRDVQQGANEPDRHGAMSSKNVPFIFNAILEVPFQSYTRSASRQPKLCPVGLEPPRVRSEEPRNAVTVLD